MKSTTLGAALISGVAAAMTAQAATAYWTGRQEQVTTVTYKIAWNCEYDYLGQKIWRVFLNSCPSSIEVQ